MAKMDSVFRFRLASILDGKPDAMQVHALVYAMGGEGDDIMAGFGLTEEKREVYQSVKNKFDEQFVIRRNTIFERAKFNRRCQEEGEMVDSYITSLFCFDRTLRVRGPSRSDDTGPYRCWHSR